MEKQQTPSVFQLHHVTFKQGQTILNDISWSVEPGQHWVIIGNNGSGKTTLLNLITGYIWPTAGTVEVFGQRFGQVDLRELRKSIGWVSSAFADRVFASHPTERAVDVVASGKFASVGLYDTLTPADIQQAADWLAEFGASELAERPYHMLSQGEKQRVLLARAWMTQPKLLILDEPCTGLDILAREQLLAAIARLSAAPGGPTLLYVTHHAEEVLPRFTHALLMRGGRVPAAGSKRETLTAANLSRAFGVTVDVTWREERPWITVKG